MKQGTVSVLIGCHSPIHAVVVVVAWIKLYKKPPRFWQFICIILHDIGHIGLDYLDDFEQKKRHWILGAKIATRLFGQKGFDFVAGHCSHTGYPLSKLYKADKYSWYIAPTWWLWLNSFVEPRLNNGSSTLDAIKSFREQVKKSIESGEYKSTHSMYLERSKNGQFDTV